MLWWDARKLSEPTDSLQLVVGGAASLVLLLFVLPLPCRRASKSLSGSLSHYINAYLPITLQVNGGGVGGFGPGSVFGASALEYNIEAGAWPPLAVACCASMS